MNKHQKAAHRPGEYRVRREEIDRYIQLSRSADPKEREVAARNLCPCHVRRRIESVWDALYRMLEDENVRVRRAAWHTLEDGGCPDDPALDAIFDRVLLSETDRQVRRFVEDLIAPRKRRESMELRFADRSLYTQRGKCDFCGRTNARVRREIETEIPAGTGARLAMICESCDKVAAAGG